MNEANANGVAPGYRSVLGNPNLQAVSPPAKVWAASLDHAWCAPRMPGMFEMEQALGNEINRALVGQISAKEALDNGNAAWKKIMEKNGFFSSNAPFTYADFKPGGLGRRRQATALLMAEGRGRHPQRRDGGSRPGVAPDAQAAKPGACAGRCPICWWPRRSSIC